MDYRKCFADAVLLVDEANRELPLIQELYENSLSAKQIDSRLAIRIKGVLEHLRSALDFVAQGLHQKYATEKTQRVYFPYATLDTDRDMFIAKQRIDKAIPGLSAKRPDLAELILAMQHFSHPGAKWFPEFMELNNKNKHVHLVPHGLEQGVSLAFGGSKIVAKGIALGDTGSIETDFGTLRGPLVITPENAKDFQGYGIFAAERWKAIFIQNYGFPMNSLEFVSHCTKALSSVVKQFDRNVP